MLICFSIIQRPLLSANRGLKMKLPGMTFKIEQKGNCGKTKSLPELANVPEGRIKEEALKNEESRFKQDG